MPTKTISVRVSDRAARAYETAGPDERRKLDALLSMRLTEMSRPEHSLERIISEMSRKARKRGLTPLKLDEILNDEG